MTPWEDFVFAVMATCGIMSTVGLAAGTLQAFRLGLRIWKQHKH